MTFTKEQLTGIIESAEDVLQALAGTHEDIHPESKKMIEAWDHLNDRAAPPEVVKRLAEIALASLEAEPVAYIFKHPAGRLFWSLTDESNKGQSDVMPVYTAPPAPVVEDIGEISVGRLPTMNQDDYPGLGDWWVQLRTGKDSDEVLARVYGATPQEANSRAEALACRAAILQGKVDGTLINEGTMPVTQFKPVADLYEMQFDDGKTVAFHTDGAKAVQWLLTCDGNKVQEYVKLERYQEAMLQGAAGNSPAIPDGCCIMPKKLTAENGAKGALSGEFSETKFINCPECFGDDECETCDGSGRIEISVPVSWTTIKAIWAKGVEHFAAAPPQEVK